MNCEIHSTAHRRHWRNARRESAMRSTPLGPCGCIRDPDLDRHRCDTLNPNHARVHDLSDQQIVGAVAAAQHLLARDLPPVFDTGTLRGMWRAGHHRLVDRVRGVDDYDLAGN
jgi:hypothetical protein